MRASRILATRPERAIIAIASLCEERVEALVPAASANTTFVPPRLSPLSSLPPQTPYTVSSSPMRPSEVHMPVPDEKSPSQLSTTGPTSTDATARSPTSPPEHMAPKRGKWTSPPPPEAPLADHSSFENRLGLGLALATSSTDAREQTYYASSSNNSEILTDEEHYEADEVRSVQSMSEERTSHAMGSSAASPTSESLPRMSPSSPLAPVPRYVNTGIGVYDNHPGSSRQHILPPSVRGRQWVRVEEGPGPSTGPSIAVASRRIDRYAKSSRLNSPRRSTSGPPRTSSSRDTPPSFLPIALMTPLPPSPLDASPPMNQLPHVLYETDRSKDHIPRSPAIYPTPAMFQQYQLSQRQDLPMTSPGTYDLPHILHAPITNKRRANILEVTKDASTPGSIPSPTATPTSHTHFPLPHSHHPPSHSHSHSTATIVAPTPPPNIVQFVHSALNDASRSRSRTRSPRLAHFYPGDHPPAVHRSTSMSPFQSISAGSGSPAPSSDSSQYDASTSPLSTSPSSPTRGVEMIRCSHDLPSLIEDSETSLEEPNVVNWEPPITTNAKEKDETVDDVLGTSVHSQSQSADEL